jgi:beta-glucanase (GH16 family)
VPFFEDQFTGDSLDPMKWQHEVQMDGFGTGSFDWTTTDPQNTYVDGEGLHIVPTLTTESTDITLEELMNGYTVNLTDSGGDGSCTAPGNGVQNVTCARESNSTLNQIINPVRSARINTKASASTLYGKIEVVAKIPSGDWLWPAIW